MAILLFPASARAQATGSACATNGVYAAPSSDGKIIQCVSGIWVATSANSQWTTSGSNIYYNGGDVGIGTGTPSAIFDVYVGGFGELRTYGNLDPVGFTASTAWGTTSSAPEGLAIGINRSGGNRETDFINVIPGFTGSGGFRWAVWDGTNYKERMIIDQNGNVGIGTTVPGQKLTVVGSALLFRTDNAGTNDTYFQLNSTDTHFYTAQSNPLRFGTNSTERMRIDATGNVGIGTTGPATKLEVWPAADNTLAAKFVGATGKLMFWPYYNYNGNLYGGLIQSVNLAESAYLPLTLQGSSIILASNVAIGTNSPSYTLHVNGTAYAVGAAGALSDIRHKDNVKPLPDELGNVMNLRPVSFVWKDPKDDGMKGEQIGFIAQEVEPILPSVVLTQNDKDKTKGLKYTEIIPVLTKAIQELKINDDTLRAEFEGYKAEFAAYRKAHP